MCQIKKNTIELKVKEMKIKLRCANPCYDKFGSKIRPIFRP